MNTTQDQLQNRIPNLTFETSCLISLWGNDGTPEEELVVLRKLQKWHEAGRVRIWISEKSRTQFTKPHTFSLLSEYPTTQGAWILGVSKLGIDTTLVSDEQAQIHNEMTHVVFPNLSITSKEPHLGDVFDIAILFEHYLQKNDLLVTRDRAHLLKQKQLRDRWGIRVVDPVEALKIITAEFNVD